MYRPSHFLEKAVAEILDPLWHRGAKEEGLDLLLVPLLGLENRLNILNEAHGHHPVHLIQHTIPAE